MQHKGTFEDKLKKRLNDAGLEPPDLWGRIESGLDEKDRRKGAAFWLFDRLRVTLASLLLLMAVGGAAWWYLSEEKGMQAPIAKVEPQPYNAVQPSVESNPVHPVAKVEKENTNTHSPKLTRVIKDRGVVALHTATQGQIIPFAEIVSPIDFVFLNKMALQGFATSNVQMPRLELTALASPYPVSVNPPKKDSSNDWKKKRFSIGTEAWMTWADRMLIANNNATATEQDYVKFRNKLDNPFQAVSFGFIFSVKVSPKLAISSGFGKVNYTEQLVYSTIYTGPKTTATQATPLNVDSGFVNSHPNVYRNLGDSIYAEKKTIGRQNHYAFIDFPVNISYQINMGKKLWVIPSIGLTYSRLTSINADMPGMNHMGWLNVSDNKNFSGVHSNIFNAQAKFSASYTLGKDVKLNVTGTARCAMNPIITYAFAKQYPWALGLGVGIVREF